MAYPCSLQASVARIACGMQVPGSGLNMQGGATRQAFCEPFDGVDCEVQMPQAPQQMHPHMQQGTRLSPGSLGVQ